MSSASDPERLRPDRAQWQDVAQHWGEGGGAFDEDLLFGADHGGGGADWSGHPHHALAV
jgi:hypothetical protein